MKFHYYFSIVSSFLLTILLIVGSLKSVIGQETATITAFPVSVCQDSSILAIGEFDMLTSGDDYEYFWRRVNDNNGNIFLLETNTFEASAGPEIVNLTTIGVPANWNNDTIYLFLYDDNNNLLASAYEIISVDPPAIDITIITGDTTICPGGDITLVADNTGSDQVFWYDDQNGASIGTGNSFSATNITQSTTYFARSENDCGNSNWESVTITVYEDPDGITNINKNPNSDLCEGESISLNPNGDSESYEEVQWYDDPGLTPGSFLGTGDPITLTFSQTTTVYAIRVNTICPALKSANRSIEIEAVPAPSAVILSPTAAVIPDTLTVCVGDSLTFYPDSSKAGNNTDYSWSKNGNVSLTNIDQDGVIAVFNATGQRRVILTVDEDLSCDGTDVVIVNVLPKPDPDINISDRDICSGESVTFSISPEDDVTYSWTYAGQSSSATSVDFFFTDPVNPIVVTASNEACSVQESDTVRVTPSPIANIGANGGDQTCVGIPIDLFAETSLNSQDVTYDWVAGSGTPQSGSGDSLSIVYTSPGEFDVVLTASEGECEARDTFVVSVVSTPQLSLNGVPLMDSITTLNIAEMSSTPIILSSNLTGAEINWELSLDSGAVSNNFQETGTGNISEVWELKSGVDEAKIRARITVGLIGCSNSYEVIIVIRKALFIPDIISPNGDGFNDTWNIELLQAGATLDDYTIELHHRQGQCIYGCSSTRTLEDAVVRDWSELADGPYFYLILGPDDFMMSGPVTLVR